MSDDGDDYAQIFVASVNDVFKLDNNVNCKRFMCYVKSFAIMIKGEGDNYVTAKAYYDNIETKQNAVNDEVSKDYEKLVDENEFIEYQKDIFDIVAYYTFTASCPGCKDVGSDDFERAWALLVSNGMVKYEGNDDGLGDPLPNYNAVVFDKIHFE